MRLKNQIIPIIMTVSFFLTSLLTVNCQSKKPEQKEGNAATAQQEVRQQATPSGVKIYDFEHCQPGKLPQGWETAMTGKGSPGKWEVVVDQTKKQGNKVLAQTSMKNFGYHFDVAVAKDSDYKDLVLSVKFKAIKGNEDQGGGPVWRYQDADNYYICRANPLENNFRVYKVIHGNRKQLKSYSLPVTSGEWHTIKIEHIGHQIKCYYDGQLYLQAVDSTFVDSGKVGLWTKADSYCYFDDLTIEAK